MYLKSNKSYQFFLRLLLKTIGGGDGLPYLPAKLYALKNPKADVQLCLVHQVRSSLRYVTSKDQKQVVADLKPIYQAANLAGAEQKLADFTAKWDKKYPLVVGRRSGGKLATELAALNAFFEYPAAIRKVVYTTNTVEGFHRQIRCVTKSKPGGRCRRILVRNSLIENPLPNHATDHRKLDDAVS